MKIKHIHNYKHSKTKENTSRFILGTLKKRPRAIKSEVRKINYLMSKKIIPLRLSSCYSKKDLREVRKIISMRFEKRSLLGPENNRLEVRKRSPWGPTKKFPWCPKIYPWGPKKDQLGVLKKIFLKSEKGSPWCPKKYRLGVRKRISLTSEKTIVLVSKSEIFVRSEKRST